MAGRGAAAPSGKNPATGGAGRGGNASPPGAGRGGTAPLSGAGASRAAPELTVPRPQVGGGAAHGAVGRGGGIPGARPPVQVAVLQPVAGRGGVSVAPRPPVPNSATIAAAGRGGVAHGPRPPPPATGMQPRPAPPQYGARPPHFVARPSQIRAAPVLTQAPPPQTTAVGDATGAPRGQWGDDGYNAYGYGQHRGSSSTGGGRGYAWQSDGSIERPFLGPTGGFVEGASGPGYRHRGGFRGHRGGRGGRGGRYRSRQPPPTVVVEQTAVGGPAEETVLSSQAMEVVTALANVEVPGNETMGSMSVEASDRADSDRASKWARKKEKNVMLSLWREGSFYC
nr:translation initiation factor IF-2-like [Aegilops tauschii subsp. strangulata]